MSAVDSMTQALVALHAALISTLNAANATVGVNFADDSPTVPADGMLPGVPYVDCREGIWTRAAPGIGWVRFFAEGDAVAAQAFNPDAGPTVDRAFGPFVALMERGPT